MKKFFLVLALFLTLVPVFAAGEVSNENPVVYSDFNIEDAGLEEVGEQVIINSAGEIVSEPQKLRCATCGTTKITLVSTSATTRGVTLDYHPDFKSWQAFRSSRSVSVDPKRKGSYSVSISISQSRYSVGVSYSRKGGTENIPVTFKKGRTFYRPILVGDTFTRKYKYEHYSNVTGKLVKTEYKTHGYTKNVSTEIKYCTAIEAKNCK